MPKATANRANIREGPRCSIETMEVDSLERLSFREGTYDSDSDTEGFVEELVDDELCYASGSVPKLQFRYLAEIGALDVLKGDDTPLSLSDMYGKLADDTYRDGCSWESFEIYRHLKFLGYVVGRHSIPWSMKKFKIKIDDQEGGDEVDSVHSSGSKDNSFIAEMFGNLHLGETRLMFDVYPPNSKFKKSYPGNPSFVFCLASDCPPSKQEIEDLETRCNGSPLKFCVVEHGRLSFLSFTKVELPILP